MKKTVKTISLIFLAAFCLSALKNSGPVLTFTPHVQDYGTMYTDSMPDGKLSIVFSNTGNEPLLLTNVGACCGTRVTYWPKAPVMPGNSDTIKIEFFLAQRPQRISRVVTATSNCSENNTKHFRITGEVIERNTSPNPAN